MNVRRAQALRVLLAGSAILFLSVGARQGFGLLMAPVMGDPGLTRTGFSLAVATQYLVWGVIGPLAGLAAERWGQRIVLSVGGLGYALGFAGAALASGLTQFWLGAGILIGLGLGAASFGVVHAAVARAWPAEHRGRALGTVGAITALGQLLFLFFTNATVDALGWREALVWHAAAVAAIVPLAAVLGDGGESSHKTGAPEVPASWRTDVRSGAFLSLALPFAASGFQVMATMTHLPAVLTDAGLPASAGLQALIAVSATTFIGSWLFGQMADRYGAQRLLALVYLCRAALALAFLAVPPQPLWICAYFAVLGLFWMSPIPLTSALCAHRFGTRHLATLFGVAFCFHQLGGFFGTWLAAPVRQAFGSYDPLWIACAALCAAAAFYVRWPVEHT